MQAKALWVSKPAGYLSTNRSAYGKLLFRGTVTANDLAASATYNFQLIHTGSATAPQYKSPSFEAVAAPARDADKVFVAANSAANTKLGAHANGAYALNARSGTGSLTFRASATGTYETISSANATMIVTSLTDSDGKWEFTVTSSDAMSAKATYEVDVYMLDSNVWTNGEDNETGRTNIATLDVDYATAGAGTLTIPSNVVAASNVSLTFTIEDTFGESIAADALGRQYSVQLTSPETDDIDLDVVATDGTAMFVFDNYLTAGESEILTAKVFRGSATSPTLASVDATVTLFAVTNVTGVNATENIYGVVVSYADFVTGKSSAAAPGLASGATSSGNVVDTNGAGIPGAVITIAADGFQFKSGDLFYSDSVTLASTSTYTSTSTSTSTGTFSVTFWTRTASSAGENITVTADDKLALILVKSVIPFGNTSNDVGNLKFSWDLPANVVMNTTYEVTATLTDR